MMCSGQTECHPVSETWLTYVHLYYLRQEVHHETSPPGLNAMSRQSQLVSVWRFPSSVQSRLPTQCFSKYDCRPHSLHYQGTSFNYICPGNLQNQNFCVLRPRNPHFKQALHKCFRMFDSGRKKKKKKCWNGQLAVRFYIRVVVPKLCYKLESLGLFLKCWCLAPIPRY